MAEPKNKLKEASSLKCKICGRETEHSYKVYCDSKTINKKEGQPLASNLLTGKAQMLSLQRGHDIYLEYDVPVCRQCAYPSQIRFNVIASIISGILGAFLLTAFPKNLPSIIVLAFCALNVILGLVQFVNYIKDKPSDFAISELGDYLNKGIPTENRTVFYSFNRLKSDMEKIGTLKSIELSSNDLYKSRTTSSGEVTLPTCWVFGCYDRERVQGLGIFNSDYYTDTNIIKMVRNHINLPDIIEVKYIAPPVWKAPNITATQDAFECDMDEIDEKINHYLIVQTGCNFDNPKKSMKTTMAYPNAGLLLILVSLQS